MIFHIAQKVDWQAAQNSGKYQASSLTTEGFIHCSEEHQVLEVAHRLFQNRKDLVLLEINPQLLDIEVRYENCEGGEEQYPHIYGAIPLAAIPNMYPFLPTPSGEFKLPQKLSTNS